MMISSIVDVIPYFWWMWGLGGCRDQRGGRYAAAPSLQTLYVTRGATAGRGIRCDSVWKLGLIVWLNFKGFSFEEHQIS